MTAYAQAERHALADLFVSVGPDAPTLCRGWATRDLAAHLVVRERRPDAAAGIVVPALRSYTDSVQRSVRDGRPWPALVDAVRSGPPAWLRPIDEAANTVEYYVHHEDVRRAVPGWEPRQLDDELERRLWVRLRMLARVAGRRVPVGLTLDAPGFGRVTVRNATPMVTLSGPPSELVLYMTGRQPAARVAASGPPEAVALLGNARLGI